MTLAVEPQTFYDAGRKCFALAEDLHKAASQAHQALSATGTMSGSYDSGLVWGGSYDKAAGDALQTAAALVDALHNYGGVLTQSGFNYASAEYDATINGGSQPQMPSTPAAPKALPTTLPSATGGHSDGLIDKIIGLAAAIGVDVPNGDTDKLGDAGGGWRGLAGLNIEVAEIARTLASVEAPEVDYINDDIDELSSAIDELLGSCKDLEQGCVDYQTATHEIRETITGFVEDLAIEIGTDIAISVMSSFISLGVGAGIGIAKAGLAVVKSGHLIAAAIGGWKTEKRIAEGLKDVREVKRAKETAERLKELGKDGRKGADAERPRIDGAPSTVKELPRLEATKFRDTDKLEDHFQRHGDDFGAKSEEEYVQTAQDFLRDAQTHHFAAKINSQGRIRIYDPNTNTFAIFDSDGTIVTIYKPTSPTYWDRNSPGWGTDVVWSGQP
ncbi:hypothetical protein [Smaragdicoccus niigatensis]|uniref:hypothetical protein n=1 Tax=Smaragdicoccus niigatensis TaxID=359359 RepID=UPI0003825CB3|nr:hypothetical protein [Smaragdicoccus niigatensis]